jgi:hypothetical protein
LDTVVTDTFANLAMSLIVVILLTPFHKYIYENGLVTKKIYISLQKQYYLFTKPF